MNAYLVGRYIVALLIVFLVAPLAQAVAVKGLYRQEVTVSSQSSVDRSTGAREAMETMLVRVSGDPDVAANTIIGGALGHATAYLNRYSYRRQTEDEAVQAAAKTAAVGGVATGVQPVTSASATPPPVVAQVPPGYVLTLEFRKEAIDNLLRQAGEPMWPADRPGVLTWLKVDGSNGSYLIAKDAPGQNRRPLADAMRRRGLPLILPKAAPTVDLFDAVSEGYFDAIDTTLTDYRADVVLVGSVTEQWQGRWQSIWTLREGDSVQHWQFERATAGEAIAAAVDALANRLARRYALVAGSGSTALLLRVDDLASFGDYSDLLRYLQRLPMISKAGVASIDGSTGSFRLVSNTDAKRLTDTLALQKHLQPVVSEITALPGALTDLHYRWVP